MPATSLMLCSLAKQSPPWAIEVGVWLGKTPLPFPDSYVRSFVGVYLDRAVVLSGEELGKWIELARTRANESALYSLPDWQAVIEGEIKEINALKLEPESLLVACWFGWESGLD